MPLHTWGPLRWLMLATLLVALLAASARVNPVTPGLRGQYYPSPTPSGAAAVSRVDAQIATSTLAAAWNGQTPSTFSAAWSGSLLILVPGRYTFRTTSDDGSWLNVDGHRLIDNGGQHGAQTATATADLSWGVHQIQIEYAQQGGGMLLEVEWAPEGGALRAIPSWRLTPERPAFALFVLGAAIQVGAVASRWVWIAAVLAACAVWGLRRIRAAEPWLRAEGAWPTLPLIVVVSLVLNGVALWWGLPGGYWPPDELTPKDIAVALAQHFSHGWTGRYPPFHYYVLTAINVPVWLMEQAGLVAPGGMPGETLRAVLGRVLTLGAGGGTLWLLYLCGRRLVSARAALLGVVQFALVAPFVYYAKTANLDVPYLFWFALAFWFLLDLLEQPTLRNITGYGIAATLAICTKDQAYGLFVLPSPLIVYRLWQEHRDAGRARAWLRAVVDTRLVAGVGAAVVLFALVHNFLFNWQGFVDHVDMILGGASQGYRMFPRTLGGERALLALTVRVFRTALGWPLTITFVGGFVMAWRRPHLRWAALLLTLPAVSYYLTFIAVVGYEYDRFLLPVFFTLAPMAGLAVEAWLTSGWSHRLHKAVVGVGLAYTLVYVVSIDVLMLRDSRYTLERYFAELNRSNERIGYVFPTLYNPRLDAFPNGEITSVAQLQWERPRWFVLNVEYGRTEPSGSAIGQLVGGLQSGSLGYAPIYRHRTANPFPWLPFPHRDLTGDRLDGPTDVTSSLRHINPTFVVYERQ